MNGKSPYFIGLAGGSASGKTTFIKQLSQKYGEDAVCVISQDHYYKPLSEQLLDENGMVNFDHPSGIDFKRIKKDLTKLKKGKQVKIVEYTFNNPSIFPKELVYKPAPIVLLEGLFVFADKPLFSFFDYKLYIDAQDDITLNRRLKRDISERGMTHTEVMYQWENHVLPAYDEYLKPFKSQADYVIVNNTDFSQSFDFVCDKFDDILSQDFK